MELENLISAYRLLTIQHINNEAYSLFQLNRFRLRPGGLNGARDLVNSATVFQRPLAMCLTSFRKSCLLPTKRCM